MTRTLADMTPAERAACVGRWCVGRHSDLVILAGVEEQAVVVFPNGGWRWDKLPDITPRFDLPRAWTPNGEPVPGEWADGHMWWGEDADTMQTVDLVGAECLTTGQVQGFEEWPEGVTPGEDVPVRRYITDWEVAP